MSNWQEITIQPQATALKALRDSWHWMIGDSWTPLLFSAIGDVFFAVPAGPIWWLSTATASLEQVAESQSEFRQLLSTEVADEWFLPGLVEALRDNGKILEPHQCYTYSILPVFTDGSFSVENMHPMSATEHYALTGQAHASIRSAPDGAKVQIKIQV